MDHKSKALAASIDQSFASTRMPAMEDVVLGQSGEAMEIKLLFGGRSWRDIAPDEAIQNRIAFAAFTDEAYRYYLPAFMLAVMQDPRAAGLTADSLIRSLTLPTEVDTIQVLYAYSTTERPMKEMQTFLLDQIAHTNARVHAFIAVMSRFSRQQGSCIRAFLKLIYAMDPKNFADRAPLVAEDRYWFQFPEITAGAAGGGSDADIN